MIRFILKDQWNYPQLPKLIMASAFLNCHGIEIIKPL